MACNCGNTNCGCGITSKMPGFISKPMVRDWANKMSRIGLGNTRSQQCDPSVPVPGGFRISPQINEMPLVQVENVSGTGFGLYEGSTVFTVGSALLPDAAWNTIKIGWLLERIENPALEVVSLCLGANDFTTCDFFNEDAFNPAAGKPWAQLSAVMNARTVTVFAQNGTVLYKPTKFRLTATLSDQFLGELPICTEFNVDTRFYTSTVFTPGQTLPPCTVQLQGPLRIQCGEVGIYSPNVYDGEYFSYTVNNPNWKLITGKNSSSIGLKAPSFSAIRLNPANANVTICIIKRAPNCALSVSCIKVSAYCTFNNFSAGGFVGSNSPFVSDRAGVFR